MNILFVTDYYKPHIGGVENLFASLTEKLVEGGNNVTCITWKYDKNLKSEEIINGTKVIRIPSPTRLFFSMIALPKIVQAARKADLIHTSTYSSAFGALIAAKLTRKKVIITVHEVWGTLWLQLPYLSWFEKKVFSWLEKLLFKLNFDTYIAVSDFTKKNLNDFGIEDEKIVRIYNGIDYNLPQWNNPELPFTFTYFGRAGASKGLDLLIEAAEQIIEMHPDIQFKFILSPQSKKVFRIITNKVKKGKLNSYSKIFTKLHYPALLKELLSSHCIVIPSYCEGFGFTAAEASALKIPMILSGMGSLPEVASGKIITMKELSTSSLVDAMEVALNNEFGTVPEKKFTIDEFVQNHISLYEIIIH
jgi:glycosyltransferase involved in cell wall biosynthesis